MYYCFFSVSSTFLGLYSISSSVSMALDIALSLHFLREKNDNYYERRGAKSATLVKSGWPQSATCSESQMGTLRPAKEEWKGRRGAAGNGGDWEGGRGRGWGH